jgi:hypothetical protein
MHCTSMSGAAKTDRTQVEDSSVDHTGDVNLKPSEGNLMIATYDEKLNHAKKYAGYLKTYFKEHAPAALDDHDELDIAKSREHLERLLSLANEGKTLAAEEEGLVMEYSQVGRAYCTICGRGWMSLLDESLYPPLCDSCAEKVT